MNNSSNLTNSGQSPVYLLPDAATCLAALNTVNSEPYTQKHIHAFVASKLAGRKLLSAGISLAVNLTIVDATQLRELPSMTANILMMDIDEYTTALIAVAVPFGIGGGEGPDQPPSATPFDDLDLSPIDWSKVERDPCGTPLGYNKRCPTCNNCCSENLISTYEAPPKPIGDVIRRTSWHYWFCGTCQIVMVDPCKFVYEGDGDYLRLGNDEGRKEITFTMSEWGAAHGEQQRAALIVVKFAAVTTAQADDQPPVSEEARQINEAHENFEAMHEKGAEKFGVLWLRANNIVAYLQHVSYAPTDQYGQTDIRVKALLTAAAWEIAKVLTVLAEHEHIPEPNANKPADGPFEDMSDDPNPPGYGGGLGPVFVTVDDASPAFYEPIDVQTELVYLRSRRFITANDCLMAESLFKCQIAAASNGAQLAEISAQWMAQLAALKAVS